MPPRYILGVDGGGSSTRAILADEAGKVLGTGTGGPANPNVIGTPAMVASIKTALEAALASSAVKVEKIDSAFLGIAGAASAPDRAEFPKLLAALPALAAAKIEVDHDLRIAHAAALNGQPGIILIAGTGSAGFARAFDGQERICGGGGPLIDDVGSGFWISLQGLQRAFASAEQRSPATQLLPAFLEHFKIRHHRELAVAAAKASRDSLAALSPIVFSVAESGDAAAAAILAQGAHELALIAESLRAGLFGEAVVPVSFCGGLSQVPEYKERVVDALQTASAKFLFFPNTRSPAEGALILAAKAL